MSILATFYGGLLFYYRSIQQVADSLGIAYDIAQGSDMTNPHHLLYAPIVYVLQQLLSPVVNVDAITIAQLHNIGWAVLAIAAIYALLKLATGNTLTALGGALLQMFSLLFWQFSTQAEVYVPAIACLLIISALLANHRQLTLQWRSLLPVVLLWVLAVCYHQMAVLYAIPLAWQYRSYAGNRGLFRFAIVASTAGIVTILAYMSVYLHRTGSFDLVGFMQYCVQYAYSNPDWGTFDHFANMSELQRIVWNMAISYLPQHVVAQIPTSVSTAAVVLFFVVQIILWVKQRDNIALRGSMLLWVLTCFLFLVWWTPGFEFFVMLSPAFTILLVLSLHDLATAFIPRMYPAIQLSLLAIVCLLFWLNIKSVNYTHTHADIGYLKANHIQALATDNCLVIANFNVQLNLRYHHQYNNTTESDGIFISTYHKADSLETFQKLHQTPCILVEVWYINPWYQPLSDNGWSQPIAWLNTFNALFDVRPTGPGQISTRCIDVVAGVEDQKPLYLLKEERCQFNDHKQLFSYLDSVMLANNEPKEAVFTDWYEKHTELVEATFKEQK